MLQNIILHYLTVEITDDEICLMPSALHIPYHIILTNHSMRHIYHYPYFIDKETASKRRSEKTFSYLSITKV